MVDDAGVPPPVYREFLDQGPGKKKKLRRYLAGADGQKEYKLPTLSPKGRHAQQVLAGIAAKLGGDHTQDLSRLRRLPGTLNRKDQRNGRPPVPCELAECHADRRYPFAAFERFAAAAPARVRAEELAKVRLPAGKKLTRNRLNKLDDHINACSLAEPGQRSQRDFALCCYCVREGYDREEVWAQVQDVGKFAERGRPYFEHTWGKAEEAVRTQLYRRAKPRAARPDDPVSPSRIAPPGSPVPAASAPGSAPGSAIDPSAESGPGEAPNEKIEDPHRLARLFLRQCATGADGVCRLAYFREQFWRWGGTHWDLCPDADIRAELAAFCKWQLDRDNVAILATWSGPDAPPTVPPVTTTLVTNVMQALAGDVLYPADTPQPSWRGDDPGPRNWVALGNGILGVDAFLAGAEMDDALRRHSPHWFSPVCLPYRFDPDADCPRWKAFLARNLGDEPEKARLLQQWAGYLLLPDVGYQRFLMMVGERANGKSVACAALTALLGEENVSSVPPGDVRGQVPPVRHVGQAGQRRCRGRRAGPHG